MNRKKYFVHLILISILIASTDIFSQDANLHLACLQGNIEAVKIHIDAGSNLDEKDQFGSTPLIVASTFGKPEVAKMLIKAGADLSIPNNEGSTPLHLAAFFGRKEIVKALIEKGAERYIRNINGSTPYDIAASPFELDKEMYDKIGAGLAPLGWKLDYNYLKEIRPVIAEMLRPSDEELNVVEYKPIIRDDWKVSTPDEVGIDSKLIAELFLDAGHLKTLYSLLVIKDGKLIAEKYFNEGAIDQLSKRASVTKSYVSALTGIAIDKGFIEGVDQKMFDFFPEISDQIKDERKKQITLQQMLQMRGGFPWEETDTTYWNALWSGEYISKIVDFPLLADPGTNFQYSNLTSNWIGMIVTKATKSDLRTFGNKYLFDPLIVKLGNWLQDIDGYYIGSGDIEFTSRDMAKFGQLYLNDGKYNDQQLISSEWIQKSLQNYSDEINSAGITANRLGRYFHDIGYGYQWWSAKAGDHHFNYAAGHGGQFIILLKDYNIVIVTTADPYWGKEKHFNSWKEEQSIYNLVGKFIKSLPENN